MADKDLMEKLNLTLLMSHLACADEPGHALNERQRQAFAVVRERLPGIPASLANSSGIFLGSGFTHDLVRPGIALYGGNPTPAAANPMKPVVRLEGTVLQIREVAAGESVGYGATWRAPRATRVAVLGAGYKDGVARSLGSRATNGPAKVFIGGRRCPVIGRISMDMMAIDVTAVPLHLCARGMRAEIIGRNIAIDDVAEWAGTISYELLTRLGQRFTRLYAGGEALQPEATAS
jgi:alanine racemase